MQLKEYFKKQDIDFSKEYEVWKFIYEFSQMHPNLLFDIKQLKEILSNINNLSEDELYEYNFKYCQKIINKK